MLFCMVLIVDCILYPIATNAQTTGEDSVLNLFNRLREKEKNTLMNFRLCEKYLAGYSERKISTYYYNLPPESSTFYNGVDISRKGVYSDTISQNRIIQLLKDEYYDGEIELLLKKTQQNNICENIPYDSVKQEFIKSFKESTCYRCLIYVCKYIDNKEIEKILINMYENDTTLSPKNKKEIYEYLISKHIEPYTSTCLKKSLIDKNTTYDEQYMYVYNLKKIGTQKSYRILADYLLSDKYMVDIEHIEYEIYDEEDISDLVFEREIKFYIWRDVIRILKSNIINKDFVELTQSDYDYTHSELQKIHKWMKKNYRKYEISKWW